MNEWLFFNFSFTLIFPTTTSFFTFSYCIFQTNRFHHFFSLSLSATGQTQSLPLLVRLMLQKIFSFSKRWQLENPCRNISSITPYPTSFIYTKFLVQTASNGYAKNKAQLPKKTIQLTIILPAKPLLPKKVTLNPHRSYIEINSIKNDVESQLPDQNRYHHPLERTRIDEYNDQPGIYYHYLVALDVLHHFGCCRSDGVATVQYFWCCKARLTHAEIDPIYLSVH